MSAPDTVNCSGRLRNRERRHVAGRAGRHALGEAAPSRRPQPVMRPRAPPAAVRRAPASAAASSLRVCASSSDARVRRREEGLRAAAVPAVEGRPGRVRVTLVVIGDPLLSLST